MSTISQMKLICEILEKEGYGGTYLEAYHDIIYLLADYKSISEEALDKVEKLGASDCDGSLVFYV